MEQAGNWITVVLSLLLSSAISAVGVFLADRRETRLAKAKEVLDTSTGEKNLSDAALEWTHEFRSEMDKNREELKVTRAELTTARADIDALAKKYNVLLEENQELRKDLEQSKLVNARLGAKVHTLEGENRDLRERLGIIETTNGHADKKDC